MSYCRQCLHSVAWMLYIPSTRSFLGCSYHCVLAWHSSGSD